MSAFRLAQGGAKLDRSRTMVAKVDGTRIAGLAGDTLASALLANGISIAGRSFKYHRPRGILASGRDEPNALFDIEIGGVSTPNCQATMVPLEYGLVARSANGWPSARIDAKAVLQLFKELIPAGFYYKTFMRPGWTWFEPAIRRMAGLGRLECRIPPLPRAATQHRHCDVLVIGGGARGIAAAEQAATQGLQVILIEDGPVPQCSPEVLCLTQTLAFAVHEQGFVQAVESGTTLWQIRAQRIVLATGSSERPLVFSGNDRPGVMLASAVEQLLEDYAVLPGKSILVVTNNDSTRPLEDRLKAAGFPAVAVCDLRRDARVVDVVWQGGAIRAARIVESGAARTIKCDAIAMSGGWTPRLQLLMQAGGRLNPDPQTGTLAATGVPDNIEIAVTDRETGAHPMPTCHGPGSSFQFVDFQNDVTAADVALAAREGFTSVEHLKRYTTLGMATDQGRTSNVNGLALLASETGRSIAQVGTTRYRPPYAPVAFGTICAGRAGDLLAPLRYLPSHQAQVRAGALFEDHGGWYRPTCYPSKGETTAAAVQREARMVRMNCGAMDASPLGKIEIAGPDAASFLDLVYLQTMSTLKPGRIRYGLMLNEAGTIIDDGVATRMAEDRFLVGTTSGNVARVMANFEHWLQGDFPELAVHVANVTSARGVLTLTGPDARTILAELGTDIDLNEFPHLAYRQGRVGGIEARVSRVSFTGELSYEIAVPASRIVGLWDAAIARGAVPFGLDALMVLRTEKGFLHVGSDTDVTTIPADVGFGAVPHRKAGDFIGKRSQFMPEAQREDRLQLVGLRAKDGAVLPIGGHVISAGEKANRLPSDGFVTSSFLSPNLKRGVAIGLVARGRERIGESVIVFDMGRRYPAELTEACAWDPAGEAMRV